MTVQFSTPYSLRDREPFMFERPSLTKQSFRDECDVNFILRKYQKTGLLEHVNRFQGDYADLTDVPDYQTSLNKVIDAQSAFMTLPSAIRKQFSNDPQEFLEFVQNPDNADAMIEMGLRDRPAPVEPPAAPSEPSVAPAAPVAKADESA